MRERQEYSLALAIFNSRFIRAVLVLVLLTLGWKVTGSVGAYMEWQKEEREAMAVQAQLLKRKEDVQKKLDMLASPTEKEIVVRQEFVLKEPGEETVVIIDEGIESAATITQVLPWYKRMWLWMHFGK